METCEIYMTGVVYNNLSWLDDPDYLLNQIFDNLNEISNFDFASLSLNMCQVYNVNLKQTNYESMSMYLKKVKFRHQEFLTLPDVEIITEKIKKQLSYIDGFSYTNLEIRSSEIYTDKDLGFNTGATL